MVTQREKRIAFQYLLEGLLGSKSVYFQPPNDLTMEYPCIVYSRDSDRTDYADNLPYRRAVGYQVTLISRDPDDPAWELLADLPKSRFQRSFQKDGLNHDVFEVYF